MKEGLIIRQISNQYRVIDNMKNIYDCIAMGKLRLKDAPKVGDHVLFEFLEDKYAIQKILPRTNELIRPAIVNVDQVIILMSSVAPNFSPKLLDRLLAIIEYHNIAVAIVITKMDLIKNELDKEIAKYEDIGYTVIKTGLDYDLSAFAKLFSKKVNVLTGNSGVGKSSLLNRLNPEFNLQTQATSKALGRGKHTTRHTQLYEIEDGWVADTPGFSSLDFSHYDILKMAHCFIEFNEYPCKFQDCVHINEPHCGVKQAVEAGEINKERYENYLEIIKLIKESKK